MKEVDFKKTEAIFFDFESLQKISYKTKKNTNIFFELEPFCYSMCTTKLECIHVQKSNPKILVQQFVDDLLKLSENISKSLLPKFEHILNKLQLDISDIENKILLLKNKMSQKNQLSIYYYSKMC